MLEPFFNPRGVVVIGASRDPHKPGFGIVRNLRDIGYRGGIYPVNPAAREILGYVCYQSVADVPDPVDLAVVIVPAERVVEVVEQCGERGIRHVVVASGGFSELGPEGRAREQSLVQAARRWGMRLIGPNCIGTIDTHTPFNSTFTIGTPQPGEIGFVSQSGALCVALLVWARGEGIGFSRIVSLGNQADVTETEVLNDLADDPHTRVVVAYMEGVADGRAFMEVAERVSRRKPLIVLKAGQGADGARAVQSHTGAMAGSAEAYRAAFRRCGVLQAGTLQDVTDWARAAAWQPLPVGDRVAVLTNAGGAGILAVDALEALGLRLATLSAETDVVLRSVSPPAASIVNPVDVLAGSGPTVYGVTLNALLADPNVDAAVVIVGPQDWFLPTSLAEVIGEAAALHRKPVVASLMGIEPTHQAAAILRQYRIPNFGFPERAASALAALLARRRWLDTLVGEQREAEGDGAAWPDSVAAALKQRDPVALVAACGIPVAFARLARTGVEAARLADEMGYPVVLKLASPDITHKSDVGGVVLNLCDASAVRVAFDQIVDRARDRQPNALIEGVLVQPMLTGGQEVIVGVRQDPQFGALVLVGSGGTEVELVHDVAVDVAPLTYDRAETLLDSTLAGRRLKGWRSTPAGDRAAVVDTVVRLARLAYDFPQVNELEINPLYVLPAGRGARAVDIRGSLEGLRTR